MAPDEDHASLTTSADAIVTSAVDTLKEIRPVFYSEADFQHALAWTIQLAHPGAGLRLEMPLPAGGRLDLFAAVGGLRIAVELKYPRAPFYAEVPGQPLRFARPTADAVDDTRYAAICDLERLEGLVGAGVADVGCLLFLTNNASFWRPPVRPTTALDAAFRIHDDATLPGRLNWGSGGRQKRSVDLTGAYTMRWRDYSQLVDGKLALQFRYLALYATGSVTS